MATFPHFRQIDTMTCGPTCHSIISAYYGKKYSLADLIKLSQTTKEGNSLLGISKAAEKIGFRTLGKKLQDSLMLISNDLSNYTRQYFGYIDQAGDKILYVIGIHRKETYTFIDWGNSLNILLNAGHYSWYSKYNLTKNKFIDFNLN